MTRHLPRRVAVRPLLALIVATFVGSGDGARVFAQLPGLPVSVPLGKSDAADPTTGVASRQKPGANFATPPGPISVAQSVSDGVLKEFLARFLPKYPGIAAVDVVVGDGVVTLRGRVDNGEVRDEITDVVRRVEGVRLVVNRMNTDDEVMTAPEFAVRELDGLRSYLARKWLLILMALFIVAASAMLARLFAAHAEVVLAPFVGNVLLRSVIGSVISSMLALGGCMLALGTLGLTHVVLSILGVASIVGLAVGFAFRDITENFIASVLLGVRRPFQIGDYVTIAGQSGVVKSLNTRATVLVTLEGNHVRIPNATIFKEIMVNSTASPSFRHNFDVIIPHEASTTKAIDAINRALSEQPGILPEPPPRALLEALEPTGVRIRAYFWSPTQGVDWFQLRSDANLKAKIGLQLAGVLGPATAGPPLVEDPPTMTGGEKTRPIIRIDRAAANALQDASRQAAANVRRDAQAVANAAADAGECCATPIEHALEQPETRVSEEGANLLKEDPHE